MCTSSVLRCQNNLLCTAHIGPQQCCACISENVIRYSIIQLQLTWDEWSNHNVCYINIFLINQRMLLVNSESSVSFFSLVLSCKYVARCTACTGTVLSVLHNIYMTGTLKRIKVPSYIKKRKKDCWEKFNTWFWNKELNKYYCGNKNPA